MKGNGALQEAYLKLNTANRGSLKPTRSQSTLVDLTMRFATLNRPSAKDIAVFREQFYTLILNTNGMEKRMLAEMLARSEYAPKAIIIFLSMEEIGIASFPLLYSPVLQSSDLCLIIGKCSFEHAKVIARRKDLEPSNVEALLALDNETQQIKIALQKNSEVGQNPKSVEVLTAEKPGTNWIKQAVENTTNLPAKVQNPITSPKTKDLSSSLLQIAGRGGKLGRKPTGKPVKSEFNDLTLKQMENQLLAAARSNNLEAFATSIQHYCGLKHKMTLEFMNRQDAGMLATLLRAMEISEVTAARLLLMMNRDIGRNAQIFKVVMKKYSNLDRSECVLFFKKHGAVFGQAQVTETGNRQATRFALSLAARDRRAALQAQDKFDGYNSAEARLTA